MPVFFAYDYRKQNGTQRYVIAKPLERRPQIDFTPENHIKSESSPHTHTRVWDAENKGWRTLILSNIENIICRNFESTDKFREFLEVPNSHFLTDIFFRVTGGPFIPMDCDF